MKRFVHWLKHHLLDGRRWTHNRRFVLMRFVMLFGGLVMLFFVALAVIIVFDLAPIFPRLEHPGTRMRAFACVIPLTFLFLSFLLGGWAFRRFGTPFADIMSATEAIATGNLSVRLRANLPGEMGRLAHSFNRMASELERSEQQRRNLTVDIAHELRTPLHVIQGNLEGMLDGVYEPNSENITDTLDETRLLARLVNDLQTLSLAEAGQLPLHPTRFLLADLLADASASFFPQAASQGVDLNLDIPEPVRSLELSADYDRLDQVLSNLIGNALRYTPEGGRITLMAKNLPGGVRLAVRDTGAGIQPEDLPYVFDRFWRGDRARQRAGGAGSGLGLAIARQLVQAHAGTICVESQPGQGTTIMIELPVLGA